MSLERLNSSQVCTFDPPLPQRAFQITGNGSTTETSNWGGSGTDGTRYGFFTVNTSQWAQVEGLHTPPVSPSEQFQVWIPTSGSGSFSNAEMYSSTGAVDLFNVYANEFANVSGGYIPKYPQVCTVAGAQQVSNGSWNVYYYPYITDPVLNTTMGIVTIPRPRNPRWLGEVGHVGALNYTYAMPGGPDQLTCTLQTSPDFRTSAINPGRIVQVFRGGSCIWEGVNTEPTPTATGWDLTANGVGTYGTNFTAWYKTWNADNPVNHAISRGLRWANPGIAQPFGAYLGPSQTPNTGNTNPDGLYLGAAQDSGSMTITDFLNLLCTGGSLLWQLVPPAGATGLPASPWTLRVTDFPSDENGNPLVLGVNAGNQFTVGEWHRVDTYLTQKRQPPDLYLANANPLGRTIAADYNTLVLRYQINGDITATSSKKAVAATFGTTFVDQPGSVAAHGRMEYYLDLSNAGTMTKAAAEKIGKNILSKYVRANFTNAIAVQPGQLLNSGGTPVDLGCNWGGRVVTVQNINAPAGGEVSFSPVTFLIGEYAYDDPTQTATVTPYQAARADMPSVIASLYPGKFA